MADEGITKPPEVLPMPPQNPPRPQPVLKSKIQTPDHPEYCAVCRHFVGAGMTVGMRGRNGQIIGVCDYCRDRTENED